MSRKKITLDEGLKQIKAAFDSLDKYRKAGLEQALSIQQNKQLTMEREQERLTRKYGVDHPRARKINARLVYNQKMFQSMEIELERATIVPPKFEPGSWRVHGRVLNTGYKGIPDLTVALYDENGLWLQNLGFSCTDQRGYFVISISDEILLERYKNSKLFLTVTNNKKQLLHREEDPLELTIDRIDYREIILGGRKPCEDPPTDIPSKDKPIREEAEEVKPKDKPIREDAEEVKPKDKPIIEEAEEVKPKDKPIREDAEEVKPKDKPIKDDAAEDEPEVQPEAWIVQGQVKGQESGRGLEGIWVQLYERQGIYEGPFANTQTNEEGYFEFIFEVNEYTELFDNNPPIFVEAFDDQGSKLYASRKGIYSEAGKEKVLTIKIKNR